MTVTKEGIECTLKLLLDIDCEPQTYEIIKECADYFQELSKEYFELVEKFDWLKNALRKDIFEIVFSSEKEVKAWIERMAWNVKKADELSSELRKLKSNPPLNFEELHEGMLVWDRKYECYSRVYKTYKNDFHNFRWFERYVDIYDTEKEPVEFEENRFYKFEVKE